MKQNHQKSWAMAYCGIVAALCVALMLLGAVIPIAMFIAPAVAGFLVATVCVECGMQLALTAYAAVSLLALLFVPDKEVALIFVFLLGYYPLAKPKFERIRPAVLRIVCKLLLCNGAVLAMYGLLLVLVPAVRSIFHVPDGASLLAAIIVLAIMILPSIINVSETALRAVPKEYEEASLALGAAEMETYFRVSVHAARSGIAAAVVLGVGRAIGEAMAIILVAGNVSNMPGVFTPVRFLTTGIISGMAYASVGSLYQQALYSIGLVLFLFIMLINVFLNVCVKNRKEG